MSEDKKYREKHIVLAVALELGKIIKEEHPEVKVVYTRKKDVFVPLSERANIANRNKADLFISIHVNANKSVAPSGSETFTMGSHVSDKNFEVSKRENAVIKMEDDYTSKYEGFNPDSPESYIIFSLLQNAYSEQSLKFAEYVQDEYDKGPIRQNRGVKQAGFLVLWRTTMPSVLTEIGFLTNQADKALLITAAGQKKIARRLADAFTRYCDDYAKYKIGSDDDEAGEDNVDEDSERKIAEQTKDTEKAESSENLENAKKMKDTEPEKKKGKAENAEQAENAKRATDAEKVSEVGSVVYSIQIMAVKKKLPANSGEFKGLKDVGCISDKGFYKYHYGEYRTRQQALARLAQVRKMFKGAFVIKLQNGTIVK